MNLKFQDFDSDPVQISFSKNGEFLGNCFEVEKEKFQDKALFPHILTKNTSFQCNFGAKVMFCIISNDYKLNPLPDAKF